MARSRSGTVAVVTRVVSVVLLLLLLLLATAPVVGQDESAPAEVDGRAMQVTVLTGPDVLAAIDPADASHAERMAGYETLLAVTGRSLQDLSATVAMPADGEPGGYLVALRVAGADPAVLQALLVADIRAGLVEPRQETATVVGKDVILISAGTAADEAPFLLYGHGDTVWFIGGSEAEIASLLEQLP